MLACYITDDILYYCLNSWMQFTVVAILKDFYMEIRISKTMLKARGFVIS